MEKAIVIGITYYKFADDQGEIKEGGHLHYVSDYVFNEANKKGMFPIKLAIDPTVFDQVSKELFPARCEMDFKNVPNAKGQPTPKLVNLKYIAPVNLEKLGG